MRSGATHLADRAVVKEVFVELGLLELAKVVGVGKLEDREPVLVSERLEDVRKVAGLGLGRDAEPVRPEAREARLGVHAREGHPDGVVLLDGGLDRALEPDVVGLLVSPVELIVRLKGHVGQEGRLRPAEVLGGGARRDGKLSAGGMAGGGKEPEGSGRHSGELT